MHVVADPPVSPRSGPLDPPEQPPAPGVQERRLRTQALVVATWTQLQREVLRDEEAIVATVAAALRKVLDYDADVVGYALDDDTQALRLRWRFGPGATVLPAPETLDG